MADGQQDARNCWCLNSRISLPAGKPTPIADACVCTACADAMR
jgi:hypothetical protein